MTYETANRSTDQDAAKLLAVSCLSFSLFQSRSARCSREDPRNQDKMNRHEVFAEIYRWFVFEKNGQSKEYHGNVGYCYFLCDGKRSPIGVLILDEEDYSIELETIGFLDECWWDPRFIPIRALFCEEDDDLMFGILSACENAHDFYMPKNTKLSFTEWMEFRLTQIAKEFDLIIPER